MRIAWGMAIVVVWLLVVGVSLGLAAPQEVGPPAPVPVIATCESKMLDVQEELIKTQDALAQWQARAIRAEAQIALAEIGRQREKLKTSATAAAGGAPK